MSKDLTISATCNAFNDLPMISTRYMVFVLEARGGIEPPNKGFADLELHHRNVMSRLNRGFGESCFRPVSVRLGVLNSAMREWLKA